MVMEIAVTCVCSVVIHQVVIVAIVQVIFLLLKGKMFVKVSG